MTAQSSTEVSTTRALNREQLKGIASFDDALALVQDELGATIVTADDELGDGFAVLDKAGKASLLDVLFLIVEWTFSEGDQGEFVSMRIVARDGRKLIVNDGGTGIYAQLRELTDRTDKQVGLVVKRGLRKSDYIHPEHGASTTYYLNTSATA